MRLLRSLNYFLTWFPVLALLLIFCLFCARRVYRELPYFFVYVAYALLTGAGRYAVFYISPGFYQYVYILTEMAGVIVVSLALYEILLRRLFSKFHKVRFYRGLFASVAFVLIILTVLTALQAPDKGTAFAMASRSYDFVRTAVLVFMVALMALMGRQWTRYDFGIALGFAVQAATALLNAAVRTRLHYQPTALDVVEIVSFDVCCLIWAITFWKAETPAVLPSAGELDQEILNQARTWEAMLKVWLAPGKAKQKGAGQQD
jgi:hypothetical protein